jgi:hypothetical protein
MDRFVYQSASSRVVFAVGTLSELPAELEHLSIAPALLLTMPPREKQGCEIAALIERLGDFPEADLPVDGDKIVALRLNIDHGDTADIADGECKTPPLSSREFEPAFSCRQMAKDLDLVLAAGRSVGVPLNLAAQAHGTCGSLVAQGDGESDFIATVRIATVRHVERLSGLDGPKL